MLYITIALFAIAAVIGLLILKNWLTSADTSRATVYAHGIFAATALIILIIQYVKTPVQNYKWSLILFAIAAVAGFYMFAKDLKGVFSPTWLAIIHGLVAVSGFVILLLGAI